MPVPLETFQASVRRLAELREEGLARLVISPDGFVTVGVDPSAENAPEPGEGLFAEIYTILSSLGHGMSVDEWIEEYRAEDQDEEKDEDAVSRAKYEAVEAAFSRHELMRRTWLRRTSKVPVLVSVEWEVVARTAHSGATSPNAPDARAPFAQLRLSAQRPSFSSFFQAEQFDEIVLGLDLQDLTDLARELDRLKAELTRAEDA